VSEVIHVFAIDGHFAGSARCELQGRSVALLMGALLMEVDQA
jgi:hypothetical protein